MSPNDKDEQRTPRRQAIIRQQTGESLVVLDNPDDGELFDTGDASDFAGESLNNTESNAQSNAQSNPALKNGRKERKVARVTSANRK